MDNNILKKSFFGYSKTSVCEYIAQVNREFSERIMNTADEAKKERDELNAKIASLENELNKYKKIHADITNALMEAQQHSDDLKEKAELEDRKRREENAEKRDRENKRIMEYKAKIDELRRGLASFAAAADKELESYTSDIETLKKEYSGEEELSK